MSKRNLTLATMAALFACNGGGDLGCSNRAPGASYPSPPPPGAEVQAGVIRMRLTTTALDFLRKHLDVLLGSFLTLENGRAVYALDESTFAPGGPVLLRTSTLPSKLSLDLAQLESHLTLAWLDPDASGRPGLRFALRDFDIFLDLAMGTNVYDPSTGLDLRDAVCHVRDQGQLAAVHLGALGFDLRLGVDNSTGVPRLTGASENVVIDLGSTTNDSAFNLTVTACDASVDPTCSDPMCGASPSALQHCQDVCHLLDLFTQLGGFVTVLLDPMLDSLAPTLAATLSDAIVSMLAGVPLGLESELALGALLGPAFADLSPLAIKAEGASSLTVSGAAPGRGLDLGMSGGVAALTPAACAFDGVPPDLGALLGPPPLYSGFVEVQDATGRSHTEAYHVALSLSQALLAQAGWAAYQSGLLCLGLDGYDVEALVGSSFTFNAGLLMSFDQRVAGLADPASPLFATIRPRNAPALQLGAGHDIATGVHESLLTLVADDLEIGLYFLVDDSYEQLSGLTADLSVGLSIERTPAQALEVVVDAIDLSDVRESYNELAPNADIGGLVALVADFAVSTLIGDNLRFAFSVADAMSGALGSAVTMRVNAVRRDLGSAGQSYLSVYATLCTDADVANAEDLACYTPPAAPATPLLAGVDASSLYVPADPLRFDSSRWDAAPSGRALLEVYEDPSLEYQSSVDSGPWSSFAPAPAGSLAVTSARLAVVGAHEVAVRARRLGLVETRGEPETVQFWVDRERPLVTAARDGDVVRVEASDLGSPSAVALWARFVQRGVAGEWQAAGSEIDVAGRYGTLEIFGRDLAGNDSELVRLALGETLIAPAAEPAAASGCSAGRASLVAVLVTAALWRLRRRSARSSPPRSCGARSAPA